MIQIAGGILLAVAILAVAVLAVFNWRLIGALLCGAGLIALIILHM